MSSLAYLGLAPVAPGLAHAAYWFPLSILVALAYYRYDEADPESRPIIREKLLKQYDFIIGEY